MKKIQRDFETIVSDIVNAKRKLADYLDLPGPPPLAGKPVPAKQLEALETHLIRKGLSFPTSYREFLSVHNGIKDFDSDIDLLAASEVRKPVDEDLEDDFPTLSQFVIGSGNSPCFISFDPETADASGEMEVVWVMGDGEEFRYESFTKLLRDYRDQLVKTVSDEEADRKDLGG